MDREPEPHVFWRCRHIWKYLDTLHTQPKEEAQPQGGWRTSVMDAKDIRSYACIATRSDAWHFAQECKDSRSVAFCTISKDGCTTLDGRLRTRHTRDSVLGTPGRVAYHTTKTERGHYPSGLLPEWFIFRTQNNNFTIRIGKEAQNKDRKMGPTPTATLDGDSYIEGSATLSDADKLELFWNLLWDSAVQKVAYNLQEILTSTVWYIRNFQIGAFSSGEDPSAVYLGRVRNIFDPGVAFWVCDSRQDAATTSFHLLCQVIGIRADAYTFGAANILDMDQALSLLVSTVSVLEELLEHSQSAYSFYEIEMPMVTVLSGLETVGISLDTTMARHCSAALSSSLRELKEQVMAQSGTAINVNSPEQVRWLLFDYLRIPNPCRGLKAAGAKRDSSTADSVLQQIKSLHPVVDTIQKYRKLFKTKTAYIDPILKIAEPDASRSGNFSKIFASWHHLRVVTGRLSCSHPNLQNIPQGDTLDTGVNIRRIFLPNAPNKILLALDYCQMEMRIIAYLSKDHAMIDLFRHAGLSGDIYVLLAGAISNKQPMEVTPSERQRAKVVCLGIIYGMGVSGVAERMGCSVKDASNLMKWLHNAFPELHQFVSQTVKFACEYGYIHTLSGRRRYLPRILSANAEERNMSKRQAINSVIQGSASDLLKVAMIEVQQSFLAESLEFSVRPRILLQVHDELVLECADDKEQIQHVVNLTISRMETAAYVLMPDSSIRFNVKCSIGKRWGDMAPYPRLAANENSLQFGS